MLKYHFYNWKKGLTFLENTKIRGVRDLLPLAVPFDLQRRASPDPALQNHHLALGRLSILQQLSRERDEVREREREVMRKKEGVNED